MNRERASRAYDLISEGFAELAIAIRETEQPGRAAAPSTPAPADYDEIEEASRAAQTASEAPLGSCPVHRTAWTVKAGGISKNGKPYPPFWKCSGKTDGAYCNEKPTKGWADSHPIPVEAVA